MESFHIFQNVDGIAKKYFRRITMPPTMPCCTAYGVFYIFQNVYQIFHTLQNVLFQTNNNATNIVVQHCWSNNALLHRLRSLLHRRRARHCPGRRLLQVAKVQLQENAHEHAIKN